MYTTSIALSPGPSGSSAKKQRRCDKHWHDILTKDAKWRPGIVDFVVSAALSHSSVVHYTFQKAIKSHLSHTTYQSVQKFV